MYCWADIQCPCNESSLCLYRTWGLQQCSEFIAEGSLKDPCFLYVFQIDLNHKTFFAQNSLESNPTNHLVYSGLGPQLPQHVTSQLHLCCCVKLPRGRPEWQINLISQMTVLLVSFGVVLLNWPVLKPVDTGSLYDHQYCACQWVKHSEQPLAVWCAFVVTMTLF